jgi:hypothetical protein
VVNWGVVEVDVVELKLGSAAAGADPVQPKEGPMGSRVEHHKGVT